MAYAPGVRIQRHSNPEVLFDGVATGTPLIANAARSINEVRDTISNFRQEILPGTPIITSPLTASGPVNQPFNYQITATNSPTSFNATGLPAGLSVNTSNGLISGTPTQSGQFNVTLSATNSVTTGELLIKLTISGSNCAARFLVDLNRQLRILSPIPLGQAEDPLPALRTLRDQILLPHPAGQKLVAQYYANGAAMSQLLSDNEALARLALPLLMEVLPALQAGTQDGGRFRVSREHYDRIVELLNAADRAATPEVTAWLRDVQQLMSRSRRDADGEVVVLEIAQALREP
jgi:hypothetical protein